MKGKVNGIHNQEWRPELGLSISDDEAAWRGWQAQRLVILQEHVFLLLSCLVLISVNVRFKDKNCALQYNLLLEKADIPTRKRGEKTDSSETPAQRIVNQLAQERIAELKIILGEEMP